MNSQRADDWLSRGGHFSWRPAHEDAASVEIFHVEIGEPDAPVLLLIHGWPTSRDGVVQAPDHGQLGHQLCAVG
jgi:hypothetical protein